MPLPYLIKKDGTLNLNGPHITGFAALTKVNGHDVMVLSASPEVSAGVATYLNEEDATPAAHVVMGQPPWYQNLTKDPDLNDLLDGRVAF